MFTKSVIFLLTFVGVFTVLFATITSDFWTLQATYTASAGADADIAQTLDMANVTIYAQTGSDNMTFPYSSYHDHPTAPQYSAGLPTGQYLEVYWGYAAAVRGLEFRHTTEVWWGLAFVRMDIYTVNGEALGKTLFESPLITDLTDNWNTDANASIFYTYSPVSATHLIQYNQTKYASIHDAWSAGELAYILSYELDMNATSLNIWGILGALLTFQTPSLGLSGPAGIMLNALIAIPFYAMTAIVIAKIVQSVIPFIRGIEE